MSEDEVRGEAGPGDKMATIDGSDEGRHHGAEHRCVEESSEFGFGGRGPDGTGHRGRVPGARDGDRLRGRDRDNPGVGAANTCRNTWLGALGSEGNGPQAIGGITETCDDYSTIFYNTHFVF